MSETAVKIVRLADVAAQPWKNGGGVTRELLAWPSPHDWAIRVSVADIDQDGSFSSFPGIERYFAVLEGEGVELEEVGVIRVGDPPLKFDGGCERVCKLRGGKTRDLNVMIRQSSGHGFLRSMPAEGGVLVAQHAAVHGFFSWPGGVLAFVSGGDVLELVASRDDSRETRGFSFAFFKQRTEAS